MAKAFGAKSTTEDVLAGIDLTGKRALVTGVSAGLGVETARALAAHGASVVGTARDLDKAKRALDKAGAKNIELIQLDLASLKSARAAADQLNAKGDTFDLVIANAGVMAIPTLTFTEDGFETQFGTNHLGHFVFINRITNLFAPGSRLVSLASSGHQYSDVNLDDPNFERTEYSDFVAYGRSKTANILFAVEFDRRQRAACAPPPCTQAASKPNSRATWRQAHWINGPRSSARTTERPACRNSNSNRSRKAPRPASGQESSRLSKMSPLASAKIATSPTSATANSP